MLKGLILLKVTNFVAHHPGGSDVILKLAGRDATEDFDIIHAKGTLEENLMPENLLGTAEEAAIPKKQESQSSQQGIESAPDLNSLLNLNEIEELAISKIGRKGWAYYSSATDDQLSKSWNSQIYQSILLRPRVFIDCSQCSLSSRFLGHDFQLPVFVSPAAMARLANPVGESGIAAACGTFGTLQIISHNSSIAPEEVVKAGKPGQVFGWQLYVLKDLARTEALLARISKIKEIKFIILTLDAPFPGKREDDERLKYVNVKGGGQPQVWGTNASLTWEKTLPWLAKHTKLPIVLKGIQTHEDAYIASTYNQYVKGIIISNHGGRALDTAPPPIYTLREITRYCPEVFHKLDILVDGGIKRGTDVVKALALGAKAVGIGRAALWGLAAGGTDGVERTLQSISCTRKLYIIN